MADYIYNDRKYSEDQIRYFAQDAGLSFEAFTAQKGIQQDRGVQSVDWFSQTWLGRGIDAASTTGEAADLLLEGSDVSLETVQAFIQAKESEAKDYVPSEAMEAFQEKYQEEGSSWTAFFRGIKRDPKLMAELFVQSLGTQLGTAIDSPEARAAAALGGVAGGAAGAATFTPFGVAGGALAGTIGGLATSMEASLTLGELIDEKLQEKNQEFTDENVLALLQSEEGKQIRNQALGRGLTIGAVESLTAGLAGKATTATLRAGKTAGRTKKVLATAAGTGVEAVGGGTGEVLGRVAAGQEMDPAEIGFEAITGTTTAPLTVGRALLNYKNPSYKINNEDVSYGQMKEFIETATDEQIRDANIQMENDFTGIGQEAQRKQNKAIFDSQIDRTITDQKDRDDLIDLEQQRILKEEQVKKKGIAKVPNASEELATIQAEIDAIIGKYEGAVGIGETAEAKRVAKRRRDINIEDTIKLLEENSTKIGNIKDSFTVENDAEAVAAYKRLQEQYGLQDKDVSGSDGFIVPTKDGNVIVINKEVAGRTNQINVGGHEILHAVIQNYYQNLTTKQKAKFIGDFKKTLSKKSFKYIENILNKRNEKDPGSLDLDTTDEWLTVYSDGIIKEQITYNEGLGTKLRNFIHNIIRSVPGLERKEFESGIATYNFMRDYNKNIKEGKISQRAIDVAGPVVADAGVSKSMSPTEKRRAEQEVKEIGKTYDVEGGKQAWDAGGSDIAIQEIKEGRYFDNLIAATYQADIVPKDFVSKVYSELVPHIKRFNPNENDNLFAYINSQVRNKAGNVYNREYKQTEQEKTARSIDDRTKEGEVRVQVADEGAVEAIENIDKKPVKVDRARQLSNFDVIDIATDQEIINEVETLLEQNPDNLQERFDTLIKKDFRKRLNKVVGKIKSVKGKVQIDPEFETFIRDQYNEIINSLGITQIRTTYKNLFERKKVGVEDVKRVNPDTGKITYFRKDKFINTVNKPKFIKYFTQGSYTTLVERRNSLLTRIAERKAELAVDNYIEDNSKNINDVVKAKLRQLSRSADRVQDELKTFDTVKFSKSIEQEFNIVKADQIKEGTYIDDGRVLEQAFANYFKRLGIPGLRVKAELAGEAGGMADITFIYDGVEENHEIKKSLAKVFMGSALISNLNLKTGKFSFSNPVYNSLDTKKLMADLLPALREKVAVINARIEEYNVKNGTNIQPISDIIKGKKDYNFFPDEIYNSILKDLAEVFQDEKIIIEHYLNKKFKFKVNGKTVTIDAPVRSMTIGGEGTVRFSDDSIFSKGKKPAPMFKADTRARAAIYTSGHKMINGIKMRKFGVRIQLDIVKLKNKPNELIDITVKENFQDGVSFSKSFEQSNLSKTTVEARNAKKYHGKTRGMSTFDFDETLIVEGENFVTATGPDGDVVEISSGNWPLEGPRYAELGYDFDFKDFVNVRGGVDGPLLQKMRNQIKKFGPDNVYVLTARQQQAAPAIHEWLKTKNINIPIENVTGLGNSTGEAKAMWMLDKFAEGYNDMYFVDDALPNVEAVKNALEQLDVKSNVQQARISFSKSLDPEFNSILEDITGIDRNKRFSEAKGRKRGAGKGRFRFFVPPSHEDFVGLLYNFIGKGTLGNKHRDFFEKALIRPLNRAYRELNAAKQAIATDYKNLLKQFPDVRKQLTKKTPDGDFFYSDAVRVYLWNKFGFDIPGMSQQDINDLSELVESDNDLRAFADAVGTISRVEEGYVQPGDSWEAGDIRTDLQDATGRIGRKKFFAEFIENADIIFSPENINKIRAAFGDNFVEALQDMLYRIKNGTNRPTGNNKMVNRFLDYINGSVGATMFFNARSAVLQTISAVNFINFADNNIFKAAQAFANQPQFWKDFTFLFNSDMLKQRRSGAAFDLNASEITSAVSKSKEPVRAAIRYILQKGFLPTQLADSFAIAIGGASFYRNRISTYTKQGLSRVEAEKKAFIDFQELAESTQQSARPDMLSQQQASPLGRMILAFQNVTSQYVRLIKKAGLDLVNRRRSKGYNSQAQSDMANVSRIIYYGAVQSIIFYGLQSALFAMMFADDEDEKDEKFFKIKKDRVLQGSIDSVLRGMGVGGAIISTIKNTAIKWAENQKKTWGREDNIIMLELLQLSPPVGIKARKYRSYEKTMLYNKKDIENMKTFDIDNPMWEAYAQLVEGATNVPVARLHRKVENLQAALDTENEWWQRLAVALGWSKWDVGIDRKDLKHKHIQKEKKSKFIRVK